MRLPWRGNGTCIARPISQECRGLNPPGDEVNRPDHGFRTKRPKSGSGHWLRNLRRRSDSDQLARHWRITSDQGRVTGTEKPVDVKQVVASDRSLDLAILRVESGPLIPLALGDSAALRQGQPIVVLGNPQGLGRSVVQGVLSGERDVGRPADDSIGHPPLNRAIVAGLFLTRKAKSSESLP